MGPLLDSAALTPHGFCLSWVPALVALHVVSDALTAASYYSIPVALTVFLLRRRDVAFRWVFWAFALFILACGTTHLFDIVVLWRPEYWAQGIVKAATAGISVATALCLWPLLPQAFALPSPSELREANARLTDQMEQRDAALRALRRETEDRLRAEMMLRQSQKMEALGHLTGGVAHDFNNLLMVVQGNLEALGKHLPADDPRRRYVDRATQGATRGATLVQQLLAFARRQNLYPAQLDLAERLAEVVELLRGAVGRAIVLDWRPEPGLWPVEADATQLETALLNLAVNARDAMPLGGRLEIAAENVRATELVPTVDGHLDPGEYVRVRVSDSGAGMTQEVRDSAFEPFFTTKPVGKGTGLGLSQVYGFVKQSRGHVGIDTAPGRGTTVTIWLPRAPQAALGRVS
ncbi:MAG: hypothetical protein JO118_15425 [Acetobacteraceae bacterium]|nr:hypothetical protein [Acetobacteraceae bacterium]